MQRGLSPLAFDVHAGLELRLLGHWDLKENNQSIEFPHRVQRVIALAAITDRAPRNYIAELLWPEGGPGQALTNLRVNICHIRRRTPDLVCPSMDALLLSPNLLVDAASMEEVLASVERCNDLPTLVANLQYLTRADLLPAWCETWLVQAQESFRQSKLKGLEKLAGRFIGIGDADLAVDAAQAAICTEPLSERGYCLLMRAHVLAGNRALALQAYERAVETLRQALDVEPSVALQQIMLDVRSRGPASTSHRRVAGPA